MTAKLSIPIILMVVLWSCKNDLKPSQKYIASIDVKRQETHPGKNLMEVYCYACHNATTSEADRIAPPMIAIKKRYISSQTSKAEFTNTVLSFVNNPSPENAKMYGAVQKFGVMPKLAYKEEVIKQISDYVFDNEIEQPEWFEAHYNKMRGGRN